MVQSITLIVPTHMRTAVFSLVKRNSETKLIASKSARLGIEIGTKHRQPGVSVRQKQRGVNPIDLFVSRRQGERGFSWH